MGNPTEAGALGAFVVLVIALIRGMKWGALQDALMETAVDRHDLRAYLGRVDFRPVPRLCRATRKRSQPDREPAA